MNVRQLIEDLSGMPEDAEVVILVTEDGVYDGGTQKVSLSYFGMGPSPDIPPQVVFYGKIGLFW